MHFLSLEFFLFSITGSGAYQIYYSVGTWITVGGGSSSWGVKLTTLLCLVPRFKQEWSFTSVHPVCYHGVDRGKLHLYFFVITFCNLFFIL